MAYQVKFHRTGVPDERAGLFGTFREALTFAVTLQPKLSAAIVSIVELDDSGDETRTIHFCDAQRSESPDDMPGQLSATLQKLAN
jgi:hypothetical protein